MILISVPPLQEIDSQDESLIQDIVRVLDPIITSPSNINDVYDIEAYRDNYYANGSKIKVLLDNNLVTRVISIIRNSSDENCEISQPERNVAALMCFFIICNIQINPSLAYYEKPDDEPEDNDYLFRVADHLPPQCFADIALGRKNLVGNDALIHAMEYVDNNQELQNELKTAHKFLSQEVVEHEGFRLIYQKLLKATLLFKAISSPTESLSSYLKWSYSESLSLVNIDLFIMMFLSKGNLAVSRLVKKINTSNCDRLLKNLKNAAWDISYMNLWTGLHSQEYQSGQEDVIWLFASNDKALMEFAKIPFQTDTEENIQKLFACHYGGNSVDEILSYKESIKSRNNAEQHRNQIMSHLDNSISELTIEVESLITEQSANH